MIRRKHNLYAADSIHCATAIKAKVDFMLVDDIHYEKICGVATLELLDITMKQEALKEALEGRV